ncbi:hypothetical protein NLI96_g8532 [Meripilus lineatus]|uniref:F-box domain-containing protein n=1 Tax=Meripilus lineatus TaxID=2056292 RepID=A0AAD5UX44_9APHY|nr:hypothetical protein NLI96_g8532 [Physisporinus lineatus]
MAHPNVYIMVDMNRRDLRQQVVQAQQMIDQLTKEYQAALAEQSACIIQHYRDLNFLTPVGRLPPELLVNIFALCSPQRTKLEELPIATRYAWLVVTRVCHQWRIVALGASELWTTISTGNMVRITEFLKLSSNRPLTVQTSIISDASFLPLRMLFNQYSSRIETLSLSVRYDVSNLVPENFSLPRLKVLSLINNHSSVVSRVPNFISHQSFPSLQHLVLSGWHACWENTIFHCNITNLVISGLRDPRWSPSMQGSSSREILNALSRMRMLESLDLEDVLPSSIASQTTRTITLPRLKNVRLSDGVVQCIRLLSILVYTPQVCIDLEFGSSRTRIETTSTLFQNIRSIALEFTPSEIVFQGFSDVLPTERLSGLGVRPTPRIRVSFIRQFHYPAAENNPSSHAIAWLFSLVPESSPIQSCFFCSIPDTNHNREQMTSLFEKLPNVTQLCVSQKSAVSLLAATLPSSVNSASLPLLEGVDVINVDDWEIGRYCTILNSELGRRERLHRTSVRHSFERSN